MDLRGHSRRVVSPARPPGARLSALLAVSVAGLFAAPGDAVAPKPVLLFRATSSASVDVTFSRTVTIDPEAVRVSGGNRFAGFYLHPLAGPLLDGTGALFVHGYRLPSVPSVRWLPMPLGLGDFGQAYPRKIPAGRYRLYVLADAPVDIRVPVTGSTTRTIRATRRVRVAYAGKDVTAEVLPRQAGTAAPGILTTRLPITLPSNSNLTLTTVQVLSRGTFYTHHYSQPASCIGRSGLVAGDFTSCRDEPKDGPGAAFHRGQYTFSSIPPHVGVFEDETNSVYYPGRLTSGNKTAHYTFAMANNIERVFVAALSIGL